MAPVGNPNAPALSGPEVLPIGDAAVPTDLGTRWGFTHEYRTGPLSPEVGAQFQLNVAESQLRHVMYELWDPAQALIVDTPTRYYFPCRSIVDQGTGISFVNQSVGETDLQCLQNRGGGYCLFNTLNLGENWIRLAFDSSALVNGRDRIIKVGLRYAGFRTANNDEDDAYGIWDFLYYDTDATVGPYDCFIIGSYLEDGKFQLTELDTKWVGETNMIPRGETGRAFGDITSPFTPEDLSHMGSGDESVFIEVWGQPGYQLPGDLIGVDLMGLDFIQMVVDVVPERRVAFQGRTVTNLIIDPTTTRHMGSNAEPTWWMDPVTVATPASVSVGPWTATVREAVPATPSEAYDRAEQPLGNLGIEIPPATAVGPSLLLEGAKQVWDTLSADVVVQRAVVSDGVFVENEFYPAAQLGLVAYNPTDVATDGSAFAAYQDSGGFTVYSGNPVDQDILVDGTTTYGRVRVVAQPPVMAGAGSLTVAIRDGGVDLATGTVTAAQVLALDDKGSGWRVFEVQLNTAVTATAPVAVVRASSSTGTTSPWRIAAADAVTLDPDFVYSGTDPLPAGVGYDVVLVAVEDPYVPPAPDLEPGFEPVVNGGSCVDRVNFIDVTIDTDPAASQYRVERSVDGGLWTVAGYTYTSAFRDWGVPWDVPVEWRVVALRAADMATGTSPAAGPLTVPSGAALIGLTDGDDTVVWAPTSDGGTEVITWEWLNPTVLVTRHGQDYQVPQRQYEDLGWACTFTATVSDLDACPADDLTVGQRTLTPTPYDVLARLARVESVQVRFSGGDTRVMTIETITPVVHTPAGVHMATIRLVDTQPVFSPAPIRDWDLVDVL